MSGDNMDVDEFNTSGAPDLQKFSHNIVGSFALRGMQEERKSEVTERTEEKKVSNHIKEATRLLNNTSRSLNQ